MLQNPSEPLRLRLELLGPIPGLKSKELQASPSIAGLSSTASFDCSQLSDQSNSQTQTALWKPLPGPQTQALFCQADELFYGGAAGGGKTDLLLGVAATEHTRSIIFRREYGQLSGIFERSREIIGEAGRFNEQAPRWRMDGGRLIEFGAVKDEGDKTKYQGRAHDLKGFDEITHFTETQFRYLIGWTRTTKRGQRTRVICTGNPPTSTEGQWVIQYWGPWLDETHANPAEPGELRWFTTLDGKDVECDGSEPFEHNGEMVYPRSRTFIPARLQDNPYLTHDAAYIATLQGMEEPMRTQMLYGDFSLGLIVDSSQLIPTELIREARRKVAEYDPNGGPLVAGVDVAGPGEDETVLIVRQASRVLSVASFNDADARGPVLAALKDELHRGLTQVNVDTAGIGHFFAIHLDENLPKTVTVNAVNVGEKPTSDEMAEKRANLKAELYWALRERFQDGDVAGLTDSVTINQLASIRYKHDGRGRVVIESKDDARKRGVKSPDRAEALMLAFAPESRMDKLAGLYAAQWVA